MSLKNSLAQAVGFPRGWQVLAAGLTLVVSLRAIGQQQAPSASPYHPPELALIEPATGGTVPKDRPVVAFRFAAGDSADPVDVRSFVVMVDGKDRSALFQSARDMTWGPLAPAEEVASLSVGVHAYSARVCSSRGLCTEISGSVTVIAAATAPEAPASGRRSLLDVLLSAIRKLLGP